MEHFSRAFQESSYFRWTAKYELGFVPLALVMFFKLYI